MSLLDKFRALQTTMSELVQSRSRLDNIPAAMTTLHQEHLERSAEIEKEEASHKEAERTRREAEAAHADAQEKLKHYQQQIGQVTNQREYGALLKEIDLVKTKIKEAEERAIQALETVESAARMLQEQRAAFDDLDRRYKDELEKWESEKPGIAIRAGELEAAATVLRGEIPRNHLTLFERLFQRTGGQAMAEVRKMGVLRSANAMWHCSACNYNVRPQIVVEIQAGTFHQCDSCKRILYWQAEAAGGDSAEG
jgi:predicted  nucleic acid-binding Zn-ribbon protein